MKRKRFFKFLIIGGALLVLILVVRSITTKGGQFGEKVAVVEIIGAISKSEKSIEQIHRFRDDQTVKAIVVRIDSPGGSVGAVQEIHTEIAKLEKPVVASMGNTAASGGYYIACAADQIVANRGSITGSIGVILRFMKLKGLYEKVGLEDQVVKSGEFKDTGSPARGLTDAERALLQDTIDDVHSQFVDAVFEGRKAHLARDEIAALADGRIFSGQQALDYKLVDVLGNLPDAIKLAGTLSGISGKPKVIRDKRKVPLIERILGNTSQQNLGRLLSGPGISFRYEFDLGE